MELRQLEHVLAVIETGSLTAAASRVGLTQQALSKSLSRLEDSLGGKLFEREARGMVPTRLGETVAEHARDIVASSGRLKSAAAAELGLERGKLVIGLSPISATSDVGRRVIRFAASHPGLRIDIEAGIDKQFVAALHSGTIDLAIASHTESPDDGILVEPIGNEAWGITGRKLHPQLMKARTLAELKDCRWVLGRNTGWLQAAIEESFAAAGVNQPQPGIMTTSVLFALTTLAHSDYLAILPRSLCKAIPDLIWRDLGKGSWFSPIYIMRRKRAHISLGVQQLLQELRKKD